MKSIAMLVAATAALLAANTSSVLSQEVCLKPFNECMETCSKASKVQDSCFAACARKNDQCSEKTFGARREVSPPAKASSEGNKAAVKRTAPLPRKVDIAPRKSELPAPRQVEIAPRASAAVPPRELDIPARDAEASAKDEVVSPAKDAKPAESTADAK